MEEIDFRDWLGRELGHDSIKILRNFLLNLRRALLPTALEFIEDPARLAG